MRTPGEERVPALGPGIERACERDTAETDRRAFHIRVFFAIMARSSFAKRDGRGITLAPDDEYESKERQRCQRL